MAKLRSLFGSKFTGTTESGVKANDPKKRWDNGGKSYIRDGIEDFKPPEDKEQQVRFFPQLEGEFFAEPIDLHFGVGPKKKTLACPLNDKEKYDHCPSCDLQYHWFKKVRECIEAKGLKTKEDKEADKEYKKVLAIAKQFQKAPYWLAYLKDETKKPAEQKPLLYPISNAAMDLIQEQAKDPESKVTIPLDDPDEGHTVYFTRAKKPGSSFSAAVGNVKIGKTPKPLTENEEQLKEWVEFLKANPLKDIIIIASPDEFKKELAGVVGDEVEEESTEGTITDTSLPDPKESAPVVENTPVSSTESVKDSAASAPSEESKSDPKLNAESAVVSTQAETTVSTVKVAHATAAKNVETPVTTTDQAVQNGSKSETEALVEDAKQAARSAKIAKMQAEMDRKKKEQAAKG